MIYQKETYDEMTYLPTDDWQYEETEQGRWGIYAAVPVQIFSAYTPVMYKPVNIIFH